MQTGPSYLVALDKATGDELWKSDRMLGAPEEAAQSYSTPLAVKVNGKTIQTHFDRNVHVVSDNDEHHQIHIQKKVIEGDDEQKPEATNRRAAPQAARGPE